jgi:NADPH2:quinone reductase
VRAIVVEEFGPPQVLVEREVADPALGPAEVLIEVEFASVTFVETQIRRGSAPHPSMRWRLPAIPGNGVGGTVVAFGAEIGREMAGARVLATTGGTGGYAGLASVPVQRIISVPDGIEMSDAVALLADGRTAIALIERAAVRPGETVLVEAAAGGVGSLLVQLAARAGARVIAAARGEHKLAVARSLGAELVVDYDASAWVEAVAAGVGGRGVHVVFDGVGGAIGRAAFELLAPGGRLCTFGMASGSFAAITEEELADREVTRLRGAAADPGELAALSARALAAAGAGEFHPVIGQRVPLGAAAQAHRAIEARATVGKTLLVPQEGAAG